MTREQAQMAELLGCIPPGFSDDPNFNWDLDFDLLSQYCGNNWESNEPFFKSDSDAQIVQDVYAPNIYDQSPFPVQDESANVETGGSGVSYSEPVWIPIEVSLSQPDAPAASRIEIDTYAPYIEPAVEPAAIAAPMELQPASADVIPTAVAPVLQIVKEVFAPTLEEKPMEELVPFLFGGLEGLGGTLLKGALGGLSGAAAPSALSELESLFGFTSSSKQAPKAGLLTGSCPPGLRRRSVSFGRDICVKPRRMNMCNQHALRRATRRMAGFHALAANVEKEIQKAFRGAGVRAPRRMGGKCGTCKKSACSCR